MTAKPVLVTGALLCMLCVVLGAFGAHALKTMISERMLAVYETGIHYQMFHASAIILVGIITVLNTQATNDFQCSAKQLKFSYRFFLLGIILFCGSLYALAFSEAILGARIAQIGIITPFGGLSFIAGWCCLMLAFRTPKHDSK